MVTVAMDPVSLAASVITVIQITSEVLLFCYRIRGRVKDGYHELAHVIAEVKDLATVLNELREVLQSIDDDSLTEQLSREDTSTTTTNNNNAAGVAPGAVSTRALALSSCEAPL